MVDLFSDDHRGYPGAYGEGVVGAWAEDLTREALFDALHDRRTYAATGDRIVLEVALNGRPMGSELSYVADRDIDVRVEAPDAIQMVELVRNGRVIDRHFPQDTAPPEIRLPGRVRCRLQYGWGPWAALNLGRICDWDLTLRVDKGRFTGVWPCWQAAPFDEQRRDRLTIVSERELMLQSPTTRVQAYAEDPTKSLIVEIEGTAESSLVVQLRQPAPMTVRRTLAELAEENAVEFTGVFTSESFIVHRPVAVDEFSARIRFRDQRRQRPDTPDWYYVRVTQHNGHMAWSSPIWVG